MRVGMTLAYLAQEGGFLATASLFGFSKASTIVNVNEIMDILVLMSREVITMPASRSDWESVTQQFEDVCSFPEVVGAVDGSLFEIERPFDYEGFAYQIYLLY